VPVVLPEQVTIGVEQAPALDRPRDPLKRALRRARALAALFGCCPGEGEDRPHEIGGVAGIPEPGAGVVEVVAIAR